MMTRENYGGFQTRGSDYRTISRWGEDQVSNEINFTGGLSYFNPVTMGQAIGKAVTDEQISQDSPGYIANSMTADTVATVVPLGGVMSPHWSWFRNNDTINFVTIRNGLFGTDLCKLQAGEESPIPLNDGAVIYIKADTAPVSVDYLIINL